MNATPLKSIPLAVIVAVVLALVSPVAASAASWTNAKPAASWTNAKPKASWTNAKPTASWTNRALRS